VVLVEEEGEVVVLVEEEVLEVEIEEGVEVVLVETEEGEVEVVLEEEVEIEEGVEVGLVEVVLEDEAIRTMSQFGTKYLSVLTFRHLFIVEYTLVSVRQLMLVH